MWVYSWAIQLQGLDNLGAESSQQRRWQPGGFTSMQRMWEYTSEDQPTFTVFGNKLLRLKGNCLCNFWQFQLHMSQVLSWNPDATSCSCLPSGLWVTKSATESPKYFLHVLSASSLSLSEQPFRKAGPVGRRSLRLLVHKIRWKEWQMVHHRSITSPEIW